MEPAADSDAASDVGLGLGMRLGARGDEANLIIDKVIDMKSQNNNIHIISKHFLVGLGC